MGLDSLVKDIALVLGVAAITSAISRRLKLPTVLGYMAAGLVIGPYIPIPLFADHHRVESLSEFGVVLVMFSVGLEFRIKNFLKVLPTSALTALLEIFTMGMLGTILGRFFGWSNIQSIFLGGALAISSTMIVSKIFEERPPSPKIRQHVFGILIVQDIFAIILLTVFGTLAVSSNLQMDSILPTMLKLLTTLFISMVVGLFVIPRFIRFVAVQKNNEVLTIVAIGICFSLALLVEQMGFSVALGAFLAGILVSESGEGNNIEDLTKSLKDVFVAIFFVSVGMSVNPSVALDVLPFSLILSLSIIIFQFGVVFLGGVLSGVGLQKSAISSLALGQIGEFSFIISAIGFSAGLVDQKFQAVIVSVAVLTSLSTPLLWARSDRISNYLTSKLPNRMRVVIGLYETWFEKINNENKVSGVSVFGIPKRIVFSIFVDAILLIILPPILLRYLPSLFEGFVKNTKYSYLENSITFVVISLIFVPILIGLIKNISRLNILVSDRLFSDSEEVREKVPARRLFSVTVWAIMFLLIAPAAASVLGAFVGTDIFWILLLIVFILIMIYIWRSAGSFTNNFESGSATIESVLRQQTFPSGKKSVDIPGLEDLMRIDIENKNLIGKSVADLNLRNSTGVTIVAIERENRRMLFPGHQEVFQKNDILFVWGSQTSKEKCKQYISEYPNILIPE